MRIQFYTKDHGIAGVPSAVGTRAVEEHIERAGNAWGLTPPRFEDRDRQSGWSNPTDSSGNPWPAGFRRIETNLPIEQTELPLPQPVRLQPPNIRQPAKGAIDCALERQTTESTKRQKSQRRVKDAQLTCPRDRAPSARAILCTE
jgi:hypothetical protein